MIQKLQRVATWPLLVILVCLPTTATLAQATPPRLSSLPPMLVVSSVNLESPSEVPAPEPVPVSRPVSKAGRTVAIVVGSVLGSVLLMGAGALIALRAVAGRVDATPRF